MSRGKSYSGALLLEMIFALVIFIGAALSILAFSGQGIEQINRIREMERAMDEARSIASRIQAGISTPEEEDGPIPVWVDEDAIEGFEDAPPEESVWLAEVEVDRSGHQRLSLLRVRVMHTVEGGAAFELRQLVKLSSDVRDDEIPEDTSLDFNARGLR